MGQAAERDPLIGEVIANRYQIEHKIGEGAMGAVYRAKHVKVGRPFAVKILHARLLTDHKVAERFDREAELAGRLRHVNVIGVVDVGETQGTRYMVMDFAEGKDLASLLDEAPFPPPRIINITKQLADGLYHAHEQGLIHRDFKPENVIVERDNHGREVPRIVDFGIAILAEAGESADSPGRLTTNGLVLGTPHYMAPEQAVADPIDHRIDLFALGIMVYEMLSGKLPFDGSGAEVARANLMLDPPQIAQRVPFLEVDPLLEAFARRLMSKQRDMRPPTGKAARELLELIETDREAAAAALGVPLADATRAPMITADAQPLRPEPADSVPPPIREALATPPQAPPMAQPVAIAEEPPATPAVAPPDPALIKPIIPQRHLDTELATPLGWDEGAPKKSRAPVFGAIAAMGAVAVIVAIVMSRGGDKPAAAEPTTPKAAVVDPPKVDPTPPKQDPPKVDPKPDAPDVVEMDPPKKDPPVVAKKDPPVVAKKDPPKQDPPKQDVIPKHVDAVKHVDPPKPDPTPQAAISDHDLRQLWTDVGGEVLKLKAQRKDDASKQLVDDWNRLRIDDTINATVTFRADFAAKLVRIRRDAHKLAAQK